MTGSALTFLLEEEKLAVCYLLTVTLLLLCKESFEKLKKNRKDRYQRLSSFISFTPIQRALLFCKVQNFYHSMYLVLSTLLRDLKHLIFTTTYDHSSTNLTNTQSLTNVRAQVAHVNNS